MNSKVKFYTAISKSHTNALYGAVLDGTVVEAVYPCDEKIDGPAVAMMLHKAVVKKYLLSQFAEPTQLYNRVVCTVAEAVGLKARLKWVDLDDVSSVQAFHAAMRAHYRT